MILERQLLSGLCIRNDSFLHLYTDHIVCRIIQVIDENQYIQEIQTIDYEVFKLIN